MGQSKHIPNYMNDRQQTLSKGLLEIGTSETDEGSFFSQFATSDRVRPTEKERENHLNQFYR